MSGQAYGSPGLGYDPWREEHVVVCLRYTRWCFVSGEYAMECAVWPLRDLHPRTLASPSPIPAAVDVPPVHVGGKMYWPGMTWLIGNAAAVLALDISTVTFEVVPAPPVLLDADGGDRMVLAELHGELCAARMSRSMGMVTVYMEQDGGGLEEREHTMELGQWPKLSSRCW